MDCMICDLYAIFDRHLADNTGGSDATAAVADLAADLVTVLPPRGHAFHKLGILEQHYTSRVAR